MKILFIDSDHDHARQLYSQFLSYRVVSWDVVHAATLAEASDWLEYDYFDVVLITFSLHDNQNTAFEQFIERFADQFPIVAVRDDDDGAALKMAKLGACDCLSADTVNGDLIMRRLRMAISRRQHYEKLLAKSDLPTPRDIVVTPDGEHEITSSRYGQRESSSTLRKTRLLIVREEDSSGLHCLDLDQFEVEIASEFKQAYCCLQDGRQLPDIIVVEHALTERLGSHRLHRFLAECHWAPVIVMTTELSDSAAVVLTDHGADDCLIVSRTSNADFDLAMELAQARWQRLLQRSLARREVLPKLPDRRTGDRGADRRQSARYLITRPILAIPVLPNGAPDKQSICAAFTIDISSHGIGFQLSRETVLPSRNWIIGLEATHLPQPSEEYHFANVLTRNVQFVPDGIRLGTQFQHPQDDLLRSENLEPQLGEGQRLTPKLPSRVLEAWCDVGVLTPMLMNRIKTCPECEGALVVGNGCCECGSPAIEVRELIHHFACALIDDYQNFRTAQGGLKCPKCLTSALVAGADFEVIRARFRCRECGSDRNETVNVGTCLNCHLRLPINMAADTEVYGYDVARLDILAYLSATT